MSEHTGDLRGAEFDHADLTGARFRKTHLDDARFRMVDLSRADLRDVSLAGAAVWGSDIEGLRIDGVAVAPLVEAELDRRYPERAWRDATDPAGLRSAWAQVQAAWAATYERVGGLPAGSVDVSVDGEWSFAQTLRHLVFATDGWLGAIRGEARPFHPWGLPFSELEEFAGPATDLGIDPAAAPSYPEVLALRSEEHTSELQSRRDLVCRLLLEKKNKIMSARLDRSQLISHYIIHHCYHRYTSYTPGLRQNHNVL